MPTLRYSRSQLTRHNPSQVGADHLDFAVSVSRMSNPMKASQHADLFLLKLYGVDATMQNAFVNCTSSEAVLKFWARWHCRSWHHLYPNCEKICQISFAQHQFPVNGCGTKDVTVKASQSVCQRSLQLQKPAVSLHEPPIVSTKKDQHAGKLSSDWAFELRWIRC